ncbi:MAG: peptide chain release factor N(5)-glutamine methyltransferase [Bradyrhizobium sp.]|nr:peptide chain release factor N(5)-glutamine methyltransferase [Bradyrhizobium sp.]
MRETVDHARRALAARFRAASIDSAELDARLLVGAALGLDLTGLVTSASRALTVDQSAHLASLAARRLDGEPVARILGQKEFWGLPLKLSAATLVPRPDTETVVELALEIVRDSSHPPKRIADIGIGTGAILLALLHELPDAFGVGTDVSLDALATARRNAVDLGLSPRAGFIACNYAAALNGPFELIVSNPPYIPTRAIGGLTIEVRNFDPLAALDGGADGLDAYRALIPQAAALLAGGGALVVEVGQGQAPQIEALMTAAGLTVHYPAKPDLAGIPRAISGLKMPR